MNFLQVLSVVAVLVGCTHAVGYGAGAGGFRPPVGGGARTGSYGGTGAYVPGQTYPPQPYDFDYQARDEQGNVHYRQEQGDQSGAVRGTYGYTDNQGLYRVVEYVADANGFRANVRTNEPGTGKDSPADVNWAAVDPPAGIQDRYTRAGTGYRAAAGSYSSGVVAGVGAGAGAGFRGAAAGFGHGGRGAGFHSGKGAY